MRKLLLLLTAGIMLTMSVGCAYTAVASDPAGKVYLTRTNLGGLWNNAYVCDPNGGKLNCQDATFEGTGGGPAPAPEAPAAPPAAPEAPAPEGGAPGGGGEGMHY